MKLNALYIKKLLFLYPLAYYRRTIKALAYLPGLALFTQTFLHFARSKVYSDSDSVVVSMGETLRNTFTETAYSHHHLCLIVNLSHEVRQKEWFTILEQGRVSLCKNHRFTV